jgi:hypothetical protein
MYLVLKQGTLNEWEGLVQLTLDVFKYLMS